ncbi:MAG TPA: molybdopterin-dependent oxidoreductase [Bryobacteraceae bacterium]|nr:molybdopterin-dependent oxidoreductase [Bryobacteraceae bacterium]
MALNRRDWMKVAAAGPAVAAEAAGPTGRPGHHAGRRVREVATNCEMCFWRCGALAKVEDGRVVRIEGNPEHPLTLGRLCARGNAGVDLVNDPDRLMRPMLRTGARGESKFQTIGWDEALGWLAAKMNATKAEYGAESVAFFPHGVAAGFFSTLMKAFGTPNSAEPAFAQCRGPREVGYALTFGRALGSPEPLDLMGAKAIVLIGSHLGENVFTSQITAFSHALAQGAKLIVVDPRFSTAAGKADWWLPIRPGTDIALLLAWMNVLIGEDLHDEDYIAKYASGFSELVAYVKVFTPAWAEKITEIPARQIVETARAMGQAKPAVVIHPGRHVTWYGDDTQRARAMAILTALLGAYGRPGGIFLPTSIGQGKVNTPPFPVPKRDRADGAGTRYPLASEEQGVTNGMIEATLSGKPYPIKGWIAYGQNILESVPQRERTIEAISKLDWFVAVDVLPVEQNRYADLILPEATYLERYDAPHVVETAKKPFIAVRQPAVLPAGDTKPGWWIAKQMSKRLGLEAWFPWEGPDDHLNLIVGPLNVNTGELKARGAVSFEGRPFIEDRTPEDGQLFPTPSGKIELHSSTLKELGADPIPRYTEWADPPPGWMRLIYGRAPMHSFSRTINNATLNGLMPENALWVNESVAKSMGLSSGDRVRIENQDGIVSLPISILATQAIRKDCVYMVHGFGQDSPRLTKAYRRGASDNRLISRVQVDPLMGGTGMRVNFVRIQREVVS